MKFCDRFYLLGLSIMALFVGGVTLYGLWLARLTPAGLVITKELEHFLTLIKACACPIALVIFGAGFWLFYQALKEG